MGCALRSYVWLVHLRLFDCIAMVLRSSQFDLSLPSCHTIENRLFAFELCLRSSLSDIRWVSNLWQRFVAALYRVFFPNTFIALSSLFLDHFRWNLELWTFWTHTFDLFDEISANYHTSGCLEGLEMTLLSNLPVQTRSRILGYTLLVKPLIGSKFWILRTIIL